MLELHARPSSQESRLKQAACRRIVPLATRPTELTSQPKNSSPDRHYRIGGLYIRSEIALPELTLQRPAPTDLRITLGNVPTALPAAHWEQYGVQIEGNTALLDIPGIARYLIDQGKTIRIDPAPGADMVDIRLFLLGTAFGIACHQSGAFPLHASAVLVQDRAVAFIGASGSGKSTLGAWLSRANYPLLTDDVCILKAQRGSAPIAHSGSPRIKLWKDALQALEIDHRTLQRDMTRTDKFHLTLEPVPSTLATPLHAIYLLSSEDTPCSKIEGPLDQLSAIAAIADNTYRQELIEILGLSMQHFIACADIALHVPVYRLLRPRSLQAMATVIDTLEQHWDQHAQPEQPHAANS